MTTTPDPRPGDHALGATPSTDDGMLVLGAPTSTTPQTAPVAGTGAGEWAGVRCSVCGGAVDGDGYCTGCGLKAPTPEEYREIELSPALAAVCDQGVRHTSNEDAMALAADLGAGNGVGAASDDARVLALVVCDGVSTAPNSARASQAAVEAAVEVLLPSAGVVGPLAADDPAVPEGGDADATRMTQATLAAVRAVKDTHAALAAEGRLGPRGGPACTYVAALVRGDLVTTGNVGDSRAYWIGDDGEARPLSTDDSWAAEAIRAGADPAEAESGPNAHTLVRWLGTDNDDVMPHLQQFVVTSPGWLLVCSDGLWNYASSASALARVVRVCEEAARVGSAVTPDGLSADGGTAVDPVRGATGVSALALARALTRWAVQRGGHDNITVTLARLAPSDYERM